MVSVSAFQAEFQPTPSSRRVTKNSVREERLTLISTNTLLAEGDRKSAQKISTLLFKSNRPAEELPGRRA